MAYFAIFRQKLMRAGGGPRRQASGGRLASQSPVSKRNERVGEPTGSGNEVHFILRTEEGPRRGIMVRLRFPKDLVLWWSLEQSPSEVRGRAPTNQTIIRLIADNRQHQRTSAPPSQVSSMPSSPTHDLRYVPSSSTSQHTP